MTGSELFVPVRNDFAGAKEPSFDDLEKSLKRCFRAIEDWADSPFVSSAHIQDAAITNAHIADASIDSAKITNLSADVITSGTLNAEVLLAGKMRTGDVGNRRVEMDTAGVRLLDEDDATVVNLPTDVDQPAYFAGTVVASDLVLSGSSTVSDELTVDINGGVVNIAAAAGDPAAAPSVTASGTTTTGFATSQNEVLGQATSRHGLWYSSTENRYYYFYDDASTTTIVVVDTGGNVVNTRTYYYEVDAYPWGSAINQLVYINSTQRWYHYYPHQHRLLVHSDFAGVPSERSLNGTLGQEVNEDQGCYGYLTTDGTDLYLASPRADSGNVDILKFTPGTSGVTYVSTTSCNTGNVETSGRVVRAFYRGSGDFGAVRNVFMFNDDVGWASAGQPGHYYVFNTSGTRQTSQEWDSVSSGGLTYRSGTFYEMSNTQKLLHAYGALDSGFTNATYWVGYTWYDADATGGTHESGLSTRVPFTGGARRSLQITWPTIPDGGDPDDPNSARIYLKLATSDPGTDITDYFLQGTFVGTVTTLTSYNTGTAGTLGTAFPDSGTPGQLVTGTGGFTVKGDGTVILPVFTSDPSGVEGQIYFNSNTNKFKGHDGTNWVDLH